jgi:hypothetical protein
MVCSMSRKGNCWERACGEFLYQPEKRTGSWRTLRNATGSH